MNSPTIVFYSYKGGVGRSLTVANLAGFLAQFDFNVGVIDLDLEAPGMHYKLAIPPSRLRGGVTAFLSQATSGKVDTEELDGCIVAAGGSGEGRIWLLPA